MKATMSNYKDNWIALAFFSGIMAVDLFMLALSLHNGYITLGTETWNVWRLYAAGCIPALVILTVYRHNFLAMYALMWGMLSLLISPGYYVYKAIYEGQFHVTDMQYVSAGPFVSLVCVLAFSALTFLHENTPRTA